MELTFRVVIPAERLYIARQSTQIEGQTGSIGHLRADMGEDGKGFFPKWTSHRESLDTEDFQREFEKAEASSFLKGQNNRNWMASFDWLLKDSNMAKVLDGNYDDHHPGTSPAKKSDLDDLF